MSICQKWRRYRYVPSVSKQVAMGLIRIFLFPSVVRLRLPRPSCHHWSKCYWAWTKHNMAKSWVPVFRVFSQNTTRPAKSAVSSRFTTTKRHWNQCWTLQSAFEYIIWSEFISISISIPIKINWNTFLIHDFTAQIVKSLWITCTSPKRLVFATPISLRSYIQKWR